MNQRNEIVDYTIEQRSYTQALVIGVYSRRSRLRRLLKEMFSGLGIAHSAGGVLPTFASADLSADYIIADLHGKNPAETAYNTWLARPHILIVAENDADAIDGLEPGGIVICDAANEALEEIREAAVEAGCSGIFTAGENEASAARLCESLETGNGTRAVFEVLGERIPLSLSVTGEDLTTVLFGLLAAGICGYRSGNSSSALGRAVEDRPWRQQGGSLALFEAGGRKKQEAAFRVLAMVDPGHGRRRMAFLRNMDRPGASQERFALPVKTDNLDLVYTGNNGLEAGAAGQEELGEIVTDVLSPGDILKVRDAFGKGMGTMIEALRTLPGQLMKGTDSRYAL